MAIKAGRVGVAPDQVDDFGKVKSNATTGYTKQEADAKFETQSHAASTYETKADAANLQPITLAVPVEMLSGSALTTEEAFSGISELTEALTPDSYDVTGLTFNNCTHVAGGYKKIGSFVVVNIRVSSNDTNDIAINGFPVYSNMPLGKNLVPVIAFNMTDDSAASYYAALTAVGVLNLKGPLVANKEYALSCTYLCD